MPLAVDVQGFMTADKTFTPKEVAAYDGIRSSHFVFKAPFPFTLLPQHLQQQATWLMSNHHCIPWSEGFTPVHMFPQILDRLLQDVEVVYVKGREKSDFIRKHTNKQVLEIDEQPALNAMQASCIHHSRSVCYCALSNVYQLYKFYVME